MSPYTIDHATLLMFNAHKGQTDKSGSPYFGHLLRVERILNKATNVTEEESIAVLLHDIVEDTSYTFDKLKSLGVPTKSLEIIKLLTKDEDVDITYQDRIIGIINSGNQEAMRGKLCDNLDNMDADRIKNLPIEKQSIVNRYIKSAKLLIKHIKPEYLDGLEIPRELFDE